MPTNRSGNSSYRNSGIGPRWARYQIERKFGEAKLYHGLRDCRYLSLERYAVQAYLTAIALNLKQLIRGLTGVSLRGPTLNSI